MSQAIDTASTKTPSRGLHIGLWVVQGLLAFAFLAAGGMKMGMPVEDLAANGVAVAGRAPSLVVRLIGTVEVLGAVGLILPSLLRIAPRLTAAAGAGLALAMVVATVEHLANAEAAAIGAPIVLGLLAAFVAWGRSTGAPIQGR